MRKQETLNQTITDKKIGLDGLVYHLLYTNDRLDNTVTYLAENYGTKAVPALLKALPIKSDHDAVAILNVLGKLGDNRAIAPICEFINTSGLNVDKKRSSTETEYAAVNALSTLLYRSPRRKRAIRQLIGMAKTNHLYIEPVVSVLRQQREKFTLKLVYKKFFKLNNPLLKDAAINIIGLEDGVIDYRVRFLKKMIRKMEQGEAKQKAEAALKIMIMKKKCQNLCAKKNMDFGACYLREDNQSFDCCCVEKSGKRVLVKFEGLDPLINR